MTVPTPIPMKPAERAPEVAVAPLDTIDPQDIGAGAAAFDKWLRKISHDYVTLERLSTVAGSLPGIRPVLFVVLAFVLTHNILYTYIAPFLRRQAWHRAQI